jgi:hypothetical protein
MENLKHALPAFDIVYPVPYYLTKNNKFMWNLLY